MRLSTSIVAIILTLCIHAQELDSFKLTHYNILNYRNHFGDCTQQTNDPNTKERALQDIFDYLDSDLINFNELSSEAGVADSLWINVFDTSRYAMVSFGGTGYLANAVVYRKDKFVFHSHDAIDSAYGNRLVRNIDQFVFYFNFPEHLAQADTIFLRVYSAHLKAGSDTSDARQRYLACDALLDHHVDNAREAYTVIMGDLNLPGIFTESYQVLDQYFSDPLGEEGEWKNNGVFAQTHTQSTHASDSNPCFISGGLDDRYDLIMLEDQTLGRQQRVRYRQGSYQALGNNGSLFNKSILDNSSGSLSAAVLQSLYNASDHLPVMLTLDVVQWSAGLSDRIGQQIVKFEQKGRQLEFYCEKTMTLNVEIVDVRGRTVYEQALSLARGDHQTVELVDLPSGTYWLRLHSELSYSVEKVHLLQH